MSLYTTSLNSGSNGNCYYIANSDAAVLVDVGISCREVERRMARLELSIQKVKAIFISHEHSDHIKGVDVLSRKYSIPVFITEKTLNNSGLNLIPELVKTFNAYVPLSIHGLNITAFPKYHDAKDPHSFIIEGNGVSIGVLTDIGETCQHVIKHFKKCDAAFLEANYDESMLENGRYPVYLKNRISGGEGHLSNSQALQLFLDHRPEKMSHLFLSHLSKDNNCPELVYELFSEYSCNTKIVIASRDIELPLYCISNKRALADPSRPVYNVKKAQLSLF